MLTIHLCLLHRPITEEQLESNQVKNLSAMYCYSGVLSSNPTLVAQLSSDSNRPVTSLNHW